VVVEGGRVLPVHERNYYVDPISRFPTSRDLSDLSPGRYCFRRDFRFVKNVRTPRRPILGPDDDGDQQVLRAPANRAAA